MPRPLPWVPRHPAPCSQVFPEARGSLGGARAPALAYDQLRQLIIAAGFELLEERRLACEYNHLPGQLERRINTCFYWAARPVG